MLLRSSRCPLELLFGGEMPGNLSSLDAFRLPRVAAPRLLINATPADVALIAGRRTASSNVQLISDDACCERMCSLRRITCKLYRRHAWRVECSLRCQYVTALLLRPTKNATRAQQQLRPTSLRSGSLIHLAVWPQ